MTRNSASISDRNGTAPNGSGKKSRSPKGRQKPQRNFSWGEVDDVQQEEENFILPVKKQKKRKNRIEKIESTLTVENPQADLYVRKAPKRKMPEIPISDDLALPSYGKHLELENAEDEFSIFLRRAEEADRKESEPKRERKKPNPRKKPEKPAENADAAAPVSPVEKPQEADSIESMLMRIRAKAAGKLRRFGFSDDWIKERIPRRHSVEGAMALLTALLDSNLRLADANLPKEENTPSDTVKNREKEPKKQPRADKKREQKPLSVSEEAAEPAFVPEPKKAPRVPRPEWLDVYDQYDLPKTEEKPIESAAESPSEPYRLEKPAAEKRPEKKSGKRKKDSAKIAPEQSAAIKKSPVQQPKGAPETITADDAPDFHFGDLSLSRQMLEMLQDASYLAPTPIQAGTIPRIFAGVDILGQSKTGSGKTAAFMIPIIERVETCDPGNDPVALIVVPTRELAVQIRDETVKLSRNREIITVACYGGKPIVDQIKKMSGGVDIVIGTPGRILDLVKRHALSLDRLRWVVLDEADRMLDIGFRPDIERILKMTPKNRQTLLFSATLPDPVVRLAMRYMTDPETYDFSEKEISAETIEQYYMTVDRERKYEALTRLLDREQPTQAIVFCRTKRMVDKLGKGLSNEYKSVAAIHGDLAQSQRDRIMRDFRAGKIRILVATDVVGRGIDVSGISHIINYDIPQFCDDYVHRVGRTGRMGREGVAFTLVTSQEGPELTRVEMRINRLLKRFELEGFEAFSRPDQTEEEEPKEQKTVFGKPTRRVRRAL